MKESTKKIIAKEGLILLGIIVISAIIIFALLATEFAIVGEQVGQKIVTLVFILLFLGYPIYLLARLVLWATKALKEK